jgi:hypothetical protein
MWRTRLEDLATAAEAMVGRPSKLQDQARLAMMFAGLMWPALSPEVIAGSCRASLLLGPPGVILSSAPADQVQEVADRLDAIWQAAQADPAAAVVEAAPPILDLPPPAPEPETPPPVEAPAPPPPCPDNWLTSSEAAAVLEITRTTLGAWRSRHVIGAEGIGWVQVGHRFRYNPAAIEAIERGEVLGLAWTEQPKYDCDELPPPWDSGPE